MDSLGPSEKTPLLESESQPANTKEGTNEFRKFDKEVVKDTSVKYQSCYNQTSAPRTASITICIHGNDDGACADCVSDDESDHDSNSSHCHDESRRRKTVDKKARRKLIVASLLCLSFMVGEIVGGSIAGSLAIMTDAAHLLTDFASFMISLFALWVASRPATKQMHFGWYRAEVVGALVSVLMIWVITGVLVYLAVERIISNDYEIDAKVMLITASVGVGVNIIMGSVLHTHSHGHSHGGGGEKVAISYSMQKSSRIEETRRDPNINVRAAFIHVVGDFVQSLGVFAAALIIYFKPNYKLADPICTFLFSVLVLITTLAILRDTINVLMEGAPKGINFNDVKKTLFGVPGVIEVHNLRIWALTMDKVALSAHLAIDPLADPREVLKDAQRQLKANYNVFESTVQVEDYSRNMENCTQCKDPKD